MTGQRISTVSKRQRQSTELRLCDKRTHRKTGNAN